MSILASNNVFPHDPEDNWKQKLDRGGYQGTAQDLYDSIQELEAPDTILVQGNITKVGDKLYINAGAFTCRINQQVLVNTDDYETTIRSAADGYHRIDILVFTKYGSILKIEGAEGLENAVEPPTPDDTLKISFTSVIGSVVGDPEHPVIGESFVLKMESHDFITNYGVTAVLDKIDLVDDRSSILLTGSITDVKSVQMSGQFIRPGKPFYIKNKTGHDVKLWQLAGIGNVKFSFPTNSDLVVKNKEVILFNQNANDSNAVVLEFVGSVPVAVDISGKEDSSNKKITIVSNETSDSFYGSIKAWISYLKEGLSGLFPAKATVLADADKVMIFDSEDSGKSKTRTWSQIKANLASIFYLDATSSIQTQINSKQIIDEQVEISANSNVLNAWSGKTVLFTANCTITVPATLNNQLDFSFRTLSGVTVTWGITSPFTWETTPGTTGEKTVGHFMRRGSTNTIILDF